ncbi:MAG TPA: hypothetical protein VF041_09380 [Gemmatimonadaceae bacterium]
MIGSIRGWLACAALVFGSGGDVGAGRGHGMAPAQAAVAVADSTHPAPEAPLAETRPADGTRRFVIRSVADGDSAFQALGTMSVTQRTLATMTGPVVQRVIVYDYGAKGHVVDTTLALAATLAPLSERTYKTSGIIRLDFAGRTVTGAMGATAAPEPIRDTLPAPAFNSTDLDLIVRSIALRDGLHARLPLYDPEFGGFRYASVDVHSAEPDHAGAGEGGAWVVLVRDPGGGEATYRVDGSTRAMLELRTHVPKRHMTYEIVPEA